jgi:hypothetical protein
MSDQDQGKQQLTEITQGHLDLLATEMRQVRADAKSARWELRACQVRILLNWLGRIYLHFARFLRMRILAFLGSRWAVIAAGTILTWALFTLISLSLAFGLMGAIGGIVLFPCLLYLPEDDALDGEIVKRQVRREDLITQRAGIQVAQARSDGRLSELQEQHRQWEAKLFERLRRESGERHRQALAVGSWQYFAREDFQNFLAEVFRLLGYEVEETEHGAERSVDLIVKWQGNRIAVQAKGHPSGLHVDNRAVQEAYSGKDLWQCHACAVITNTRFTKQAIADAAQLGCIMIDELSLRDFILGKRDLWQECVAARKVGPPRLPPNPDR